MKLPDFHEELNQGAEKVFGVNAQEMIDSLLYAKMPPKLKRSVNMARLEKATYEEIVAHLERKLELNGLEAGDDIPVPTMSVTPTATRPGTGLLSSGIDPAITCNYCKNWVIQKMNVVNSNRKKDKNAMRASTKKEYPKCPTCEKNKPHGGTVLERRWSPQTDEDWRILKLTMRPQVTTTPLINNYFHSEKPEKLNLQRLQTNENFRVRQYIIFDPSNLYYTEYYTSLKETPIADWQQQMATPATYFTTLVPTSNRLQTDTSSIRLIPLIDDYNSITLTLTMVLTPTGTLFPTINIFYTSTTIITSQIRT